MQLDEYTTTGGLATTTEVRALVWTEAEHEDVVFGSVLAKARRCSEEEVNSEVKEPFLAQGWTAETHKYGLIQSYIRSNTRKSGFTWSANEVWGVEEINGRKRFTRRIHFTAQRKVITARLVYDYTW
ncbi:hypothetical protein APHAL10511_004139 [Amanita phalloides]|nr:hypothetical protein APHAL10511_004139 [Amanita phalloides]